MKQIEPGCLAMIINSKGSNDGLQCYVIRWIGLDDIYQEDVWEVDRRLPRFNKSGMLRGYDCLVPHRNLLRIDDPELEQEREKEAVIVR